MFVGRDRIQSEHVIGLFNRYAKVALLFDFCLQRNAFTSPDSQQPTLVYS
jgi:hypothetical protein